MIGTKQAYRLKGIYNFRLKRYYNTLRVSLNQRQIVRSSKSRKLIFLNPVAPHGFSGHVEHYYHFVFDLILPLDSLFRKVSKDTVFAFEDFGPFSEQLQKLFPGRIVIEEASGKRRARGKMDLIGMNPLGVVVKRNQIENLRHRVFKVLGLTDVPNWNKILLIERMPPSAYYIESANIKGGGSLRRSIVNHEDLKTSLSRMVKDQYAFENIQLETLPFVEQVKLFSEAKVVIAQHGAGLANSIWMKPESVVLELNNDPFMRRHFSVISNLRKHSYHSYLLERRHAVIDIEDIEDWLSGIEELFPYFCTRRKSNDAAVRGVEILSLDSEGV